MWYLLEYLLAKFRVPVPAMLCTYLSRFSAGTGGAEDLCAQQLRTEYILKHLLPATSLQSTFFKIRRTQPLTSR